MVDISMESQGQQVMEAKEVLKDNLGTAVDSLSLGISSHYIQGLQEVQAGHQFILSPVKVRNTQKFLGETQNLLIVIVDTSMESQVQQVMEAREVLRGNLGTAVDSLSLGMSSHHMVALREDPEGHQFNLSPLIVNNTQ